MYWKSRSLLGGHSLAILLFHFALQLRAAGPVASFDVRLTHVPEGPEISEAYAIPATLGTMATNLHLDNANGGSWVLSTLLPDDQYHGLSKFPFTGDTNCPPSSQKFGDGTDVEGYYESTTVKLGEFGLEQKVLAAQSIEPADRFCLHSIIRGNMGFSYRASSWVQAAYKQGRITPVFSFDLRLVNGGPPPRVLLSVDPDSVPRETIWFPRHEEDEDEPDDNWTFLASEDETDNPYLLDAGTSGLYLPIDVARNYYQGAGFQNLGEVPEGRKVYWFIGCGETHAMPVLRFSIGALDVEIPGSDLIGVESLENPGWCMGNLVGYDNSPDSDDSDDSENEGKRMYFGLGIPFMKQFIIHFDMADDGRVGIQKP